MLSIGIWFLHLPSIWSSLHNQYGARRKLYHTIGTTPDNALVQRRMPRGPDNQKLRLDLRRIVYDVTDRMAGYHVRMQRKRILVRQRSRPLDGRMVSTRSAPCLLTDLFNELR